MWLADDGVAGAVVGVVVVAAPAAGSVRLSSVFFALAICGPFIYLLSGRKNGNGLCHLCDLPLSLLLLLLFTISCFFFSFVFEAF